MNLDFTRHILAIKVPLMQKCVRYKHSIFVDKKKESHFGLDRIRLRNKFSKRYLVRTEQPTVSQGITEYDQNSIKDCLSNIDHSMHKASDLKIKIQDPIRLHTSKMNKFC